MSHLQVNSQQSLNAAELSSDLIRQFGYNHQNYTLYPEPSHFIEAFDTQAYIAWVNSRKIGGNRRSLSLYVHIPFCSSLCFYCQHSQIITNDQAGIKRYLDHLAREIKLQGNLFQDDPKVEQLHFGGGIPTFLNDGQLGSIMHEIRQNFNLIQNGEYFIEIDPRQVARTSLKTFSDMGFNCVVIGVQDFTQKVQQAIHRFQSEQDTLHVIQAAQQQGFKSVRIELIYGLPKQGIKEFGYTLEKIIGANPNQINLVNYLHLPEKFKPQRRINVADLPLTETKLKLFQFAISRLIDAGYTHIGMNLFAKHDDPLVTARRQGRLHYNLQGFSIYPDSNLVALGLSAIGNIGPTLSQNHSDLLQYYDKLAHDQIPIMRGLELSADDLLRRSVIHALICHSVLSFESVETIFPIDFKHYFATELIELLAHEKAGLLTLDDEEITITPKGRLLISGICMVFDKYLRISKERSYYSKVI
jgi:oxygen-independent coproporphyrinogen III oxidase